MAVAVTNNGHHCPKNKIINNNKNNTTMRTFRVNVIGCNVAAFMIAFAGYIKSWHEGWFNDRVFEIEAPQEIYDEIDNLREECIEIFED